MSFPLSSSLEKSSPIDSIVDEETMDTSAENRCGLLPSLDQNPSSLSSRKALWVEVVGAKAEVDASTSEEDGRKVFQQEERHQTK